MKISISDLKKAIDWINIYSNDTHVSILAIHNLTISLKDKYQTQVEITLFEDSNMLPKIKKEDNL